MSNLQQSEFNNVVLGLQVVVELGLDNFIMNVWYQRYGVIRNVPSARIGLALAMMRRLSSLANSNTLRP